MENKQNWIFVRFVLAILVLISWHFNYNSDTEVIWVLINLLFLTYFITLIVKSNVLIKSIALLAVVLFVNGVLKQDIASGWHFNEAAGFYATLVAICIGLEVIFTFFLSNSQNSIKLKNRVQDASDKILIDNNKENLKKGFYKFVNIIKNNKKKFIGLIFIIFVIIIFLIVGRFIFNNFVGYRTFSIEDNILVVYDKNSYEVQPEIYGNWYDELYSENQYYDDLKQKLTDDYGYTNEEAKSVNFATYDNEFREDVANLEINFDFSTDNAIENNGTLEVTASYNEEMAKEEKIQVVDTTFEIKITNLREKVIAEELKSKYSDSEEILSTVKEESSVWEDEDNYNKKIELVGKYLSKNDDFEDYSYYGYDNSQEIKFIYHITANYEKFDEEKDDEEYCTVTSNIYKKKDEIILDEEFEYSCNEYYSLDELTNEFEKIE